MKRLRKEKHILTLLMTLALMISVLAGDSFESRAAGNYAEAMQLIAGYKDGELEIVVPAFAVDEGNVMSIYSGLYNFDACDQIIVTMPQDGEVDVSDAEMKYVESLNMAYWEVEKPAGVDIPAAANPVQGETGIVVYYYVDNEQVKIGTAEITLKDWTGDFGLSVEGLPDDLQEFPAIVLDQSGNCIAAIFEEDTVLALYGDADTFYGEGSGGNDEDPGDADDTGDDDAGDTGDDDDDDKRDDDEEKKEIDFKVIAIAGIVLVAVIAVLLLVMKKKRGQSSNNNQGTSFRIDDGGADTSFHVDNGRADASFDLDDIGVTENFVEDVEITTPPNNKYWLSAQGGYMNGRVYPIEEKGITIGRDLSNIVNYPKDTRGVSRTHAKLYWNHNHLMLMDLNSTSGTFVKGVGKLQPMQPVEVHSGSVFYIGEKKNAFIIK